MMNILKSLFLLICISPFLLETGEASLFDSKIGGVINVQSLVKLPSRREGVLVISAYHNSDDKKAFAQTKVVNPTFPQAFLIGPKNMSKVGVPFRGPFIVKARFIERSQAKSKSYFYGETEKGSTVLLGERNLNIKIK